MGVKLHKVFLLLTTLWFNSFAIEVKQSGINIVNKSYETDLGYDENCPKNASSSYISISINYPEIIFPSSKKIEDKINTKLKELSMVKTLEKSTSYNISYEIKYFDNNHLSVLFKGDAMSCGAAHGYTWYDGVNFNLATGNVYGIGDFFDKSEIEQLKKRVKNYYKEKYPKQYLSFTFDEDELLNDFTFDNRSVNFYFDMYEIAAAYFDSSYAKIYIDNMRSILSYN